MMRRIFFRPALSAAIFLLWAVLTNAASPGTLLLGALLALILPFATQSFWPGAPRMARPGLVFKLAARIAADIVMANLTVARRVIGPVAELKPAFIEVPLDVHDPFVATLLGSVVSLTPGTVSIDVDQTRRVLCLHALDAPDPDAVIREIKQRYEAPIKEIFSC